MVSVYGVKAPTCTRYFCNLREINEISLHGAQNGVQKVAVVRIISCFESLFLVYVHWYSTFPYDAWFLSNVNQPFIDCISHLTRVIILGTFESKVRSRYDIFPFA